MFVVRFYHLQNCSEEIVGPFTKDEEAVEFLRKAGYGSGCYGPGCDYLVKQLKKDPEVLLPWTSKLSHVSCAQILELTPPPV